MIIIRASNLNLADTLESGQCFRSEKELDDSYTIILIDRVVNIKQESDNIYVKSNVEENLKEVITHYLDLKTDYERINKKLILKDKSLTKYIEKSKGLKILNQDKFEMLISYIISANNNVKRISSIINNISKDYGTKIIYNNKEYFLFPTYEQLKNIKLKDLEKYKLGYRDKYMIDAIEKLNANKNLLKDLENINSDEAIMILRKISGVGPKVASCILLFGYHRFDVYPIDTWVKKTIEKDYKQIGPNQKDITEFTKNLFGEYSGLAIQYMYNASRNKGD